MELVPLSVWITLIFVLLASAALYASTPRYPKLAWLLAAVLLAASVFYVETQIALYQEMPQLFMFSSDDPNVSMRLVTVNVIACAVSYIGFYRFCEWKHNCAIHRQVHVVSQRRVTVSST